MGLRTLLARMLPGSWRASSDDRSVWGNFWFEPVGLRTLSGARVSATAAMTLPTVFACVRVLAESFAVMPFVLYRQDAVDKKRSKVQDHWLQRLFCRAPNRFQTPFEWRLMLMGHLALRGNAFCQITGNSRGEIRELLPLHPDRMQVELLDNGSFRYRYVDQTGKVIHFARQEIWHLRGLSSDGYVGLSPIEVAREAIGEGLAMQGYSARFFANDARPGGWVEFPGSFADAAARTAFRDSWQQAYGGQNLRKVAVLEKGMKYHELALNNSDAQFIEARGYKVPEICRIFRVPPHKVADLSRATFSNIESQSIEFWTDTMLPWAECWESSIEYFLLGEGTDLEVEFDMRRLMRGDSASRTAYYQGGIQSGWLTRNEAREAEGYDPLDGLDEPLRPLNMVEESAAEDLTGAADDPPDPADSEPNDATGAAGKRLAALLRGNIDRMARRIAGGSRPSATVLADALAISEEDARRCLEGIAPDSDMEQASRQLAAAAGNSALDSGPAAPDSAVFMAMVAQALERVAAAVDVIAKIKAPDVNVSVALPASAQVNVTNQVPEQPAPVVNVTNEFQMPIQPAPIVNVVNEVQPAPVEVHSAAVPAPIVNVTNEVQLPTPPAPIVHVTNEVPPATVEVHAPAAAAPVVNVTNDVRPSPVVMTPPTLAVQTVERDQYQEITRTVTRYSNDEPPSGAGGR